MNPSPNESRAPGRAGRTACIVLVLGMGALLLCDREAAAITQLKRGAAAPLISLRDLAGAPVSTADLRGRVVILIFGEVYHDRTRQACAEVEAVLRDERFDRKSIVPLLVVAHEPKAEGLDAEAGKLPAVIVRDPERRAFGAYEVAVMPSTIVVDPEGRVVHAWAGLTPRFGDTLTDSLLFGAGKLSAERFEQALSPQAEPGATESQVRAARVALLARQLARRGLDEMAAEKYAEALAIDAERDSARLELGMLLLKRRRLADAEAQFRAVLAREPESVQAMLGLAFVQTLRGGSELPEAERAVREVLVRTPAQPRAHYLLGLIHEQRGKPDDAAASFKKAAQLLLEGAEQE